MRPVTSRRLTTWAALTLWLLAGAAGAAWADAPAPRVLTLAEALDIAARNNTEIRKARETKIANEGRYVQERSAALPRFTATAAASRDVSDPEADFGQAYRTDSLLGKVGVTQALYTWGRIPSAIRIAGLGLAVWEDDLAAARQAAVRDVTAAFYDVLLAKARVDIAARGLEQKERHLDEARKRLAAGTATDFDVLAAEVDVRNASPAVISSGNGERMARERLRFLIGAEEEVDVSGSLEGLAASAPAYDEVLAAALARRPELAQVARGIAIGEELVRLYAAGTKPRLDLQADLGWMDLETGGAGASGETWSASLVFSYPFFDGGQTRGRVAQARSDVASMRLDEHRLRETITLQVRESLNAVREAAETIDAVTGLVSQAERLLAMAEEGFRFGVKTKLEVDDAALNLFTARVNLARARRDQAVALVSLRWVMGGL